MGGMRFRNDPPPLGGGTYGTGGGAALLAAVAALCVVTLSVLGLSRAASAQALTDKAASEAAGYYGACLEANRDIAEMRESRADGRLARTYRISDTQELRVEARVSADGSWEVLEWRAVPDAGWSPDGTVQVAP